MSRTPPASAWPSRRRAATFLELSDIHTYYGAIHALKGISLEVREGEIVTSSGPTARASRRAPLVGLQPAAAARSSSGPGHFARRRTSSRAASCCPGGAPALAAMTVRENLEMGAYAAGADSRDEAWTRFSNCSRASRRAGPECRDAVGGRAADVRDRAGADGPAALLLLDEPSLGLAPIFVARIFARRRGSASWAPHPARRAERAMASRTPTAATSSSRAASCSATPRRR